jgi:hypothetical protein
MTSPLQRTKARLELAFTGDYPGTPCARVNGRHLTDDETSLLLICMGIEERGHKGLLKLFKKVGAEPIPGSVEYKPWEGDIIISYKPLNADLTPFIPKLGTCCERMRQRWTITLDSEDIRDLGWKRCPYCKTPFP